MMGIRRSRLRCRIASEPGVVRGPGSKKDEDGDSALDMLLENFWELCQDAYPTFTVDPERERTRNAFHLI